ncbi:MAG TPA: TM1812 family CRISPR-associated protein [Thermodesulfobacteriota bacterium]|nr:TM1812 family CRISPR-associated protein [Thermodesulfobacteriota bacterium]
MGVLLTTLGTGAYGRVRWRLEGGSRDGRPVEHETAYAPVATAALVGGCTEARVLVTAEARAAHWETCCRELEALGLAAQPVEIPPGRTEEEIWAIFERVLDAAAGAREITLDVTHAFRHLAFVLFGSTNYLAALRGTRVAGVYYGAYDVRADGRAPLLDLGSLLTLGEWSYAARSLRETGNSRWLGELIRRERASFFRRHGEFRELFDRLGKALETLGWALPAGLPLESGRDAAKALAALDAVERDPRTPAPLRPLVESLRETLAPIALVGCPEKKTAIALDEAELRRELALARRYLDWGWADRAVLLLREWVINRCLHASGRREGWLSYGDLRQPAERALNGVAERARFSSASPGGGGRRAGSDPGGTATRPAPADSVDRGGQRWLASLWDRVAELRNTFAHLAYRPEWAADLPAKLERRIREQLADCEARCAEDAAWRTDPPGGAGRILVTPLGMSPGVLFTALKRLAPDRALVITSREAEPLAAEACRQAGWPADRAAWLVVEDPHACFSDVQRVLDWARPVVLAAAEVLVNVTGGTTAMQYLAERVAGEATRLGIPTQRYALLDRRSPDDQRREPYVLGECLPLEGDAASGPTPA